jgi:hypothetical protein
MHRPLPNTRPYDKGSATQLLFCVILTQPFLKLQPLSSFNRRYCAHHAAATALCYPETPHESLEYGQPLLPSE